MSYTSIEDLYNQNGITDEQVVIQAKGGNEQATEYILRKYKPVVIKKSNKYFGGGFEKDDMIQEGMIGLYKAIKSFNDEKDSSFKSFASMCVERQLITAVKGANRKKFSLLNNSVSMNETIEDNENTNQNELEKIIVTDENKKLDPYFSIEKKEFYDSIMNQIDNKLSDLEKRVLNEYLKGIPYTKIAENLNCSVKTVDTALTRVRRKGNKILNDYNK